LQLHFKVSSDMASNLIPAATWPYPYMEMQSPL